MVPHPPYSPDIAPSDYHLLRPLKLFLKEKRFAKYEDPKMAVLGKLNRFQESQPTRVQFRTDMWEPLVFNARNFGNQLRYSKL
uniref:Histone-lysine N-methyltransferase SETMAR n=1 Tax=Caenorhabditis japonica TaxID=281687 RepID=A0A8R1HIJ7_CAEJA